MSALLIQCPGDTVQTGTGKVDPARKIKCTRVISAISYCSTYGTLFENWLTLSELTIDQTCLYLFAIFLLVFFTRTVVHSGGHAQ